MIHRYALILCVPALLVLALCAKQLGRAMAEDVPAKDALTVNSPASGVPVSSTDQLVVLRNGEVLTGRISREADRYVITRQGSEARLPTRDVDFVCQSRDEAYTIQQRRMVPDRVEDHLNLATWCMKQGLNGYAARELTAAMTIDPKNPRVAALDDRLQRALLSAAQPDSSNSSTVNSPVGLGDSSKAAVPTSAAELDRQVRSLPVGTVEEFTKAIQPMLLNHCATAGCHGASAASSYTLARPAMGAPTPRRLTQRNLYNTLQWIDHEKPSESKLLSAAQQAHGQSQGASVSTLSPAKYQELVAWVWQSTTAGKPNSGTIAAPPPFSAPASPAPWDRPAPSPSPVLASPPEPADTNASRQTIPPHRN
jgi:hypothetical protein